MVKKKKFRSLFFTLMLAFMAVSAFILVFVSSLNVYFDSKNQENVITRLQQFISRDAANAVKNFTEKKMELLRITAGIYGLMEKYKDLQEVVLSKLLSIDPAFRTVAICDANGAELMKVSRLSRSSLYWQIAYHSRNDALTHVKLNKEYISPVYIDKVTNEPMVFMAVRITNSYQSFTGMVLVDVNLKFMWDLVANIKVGKNGLVYVVDSSGTLIAFKDVNRVLKGENLSGLGEVSVFLKRGETPAAGRLVLSKGISGTSVVTTHAALGIPDWAVIVELPIWEVYSNVINMVILSLLAMATSFVLTVIMSVFISKRITKPINLASDSLKSIADGDGDLTKRILITSNNEIGLLARYFNDFTDSLITIINQVKVVSTSAKKSSDSLSYSSGLSSAALEQVTKTMEEVNGKIIVFKEEINCSKDKIIDINNNISKISELIAGQSSDVNESSVSITQMLASINNVLNITRIKHESSNALVMHASRGNDVIQNSSIIMKEISESTNIINDFIEMINNIASQTNILSMNAAIEASHAGEYGKGFSVIADQIRTLFDSITQYSKEISNSLKKIIANIQLSNNMSLDVGQIFMEMLHGTKEISDSILEIQNAMDELAAGGNQVVIALNSLVDLSNMINDLSTHIKTDIGVITQSMVNISDSSNIIDDSIKDSCVHINQTYKEVKMISTTGLENLKTITELDVLINKFKIK